MNTPPISINDQNSYKENGFLIVKNLFDKEEVEAIRNDAKYIFQLQLASKGYAWNYLNDVDEKNFKTNLYSFFINHYQVFLNCGKHIQHLISLHRLSLDNRIINILKTLGLKFPNIATRPVLYFNTPHLAIKEVFYKTPSHQDAFSMDPSHDATIVWIPLINVNKNLGALEIVPASHKEGLLTVGTIEGLGLVDKYSDKDFTPVELNQGDALFFSSFLVHRSGNNITNSIRWSAHFRYNNMEDPYFIKRNYPHPYIYKPISKTE